MFIINQFLNAVSRGVVAAGGQPNQVLGDGLLALFGLAAPAESPAVRRSPPAPRIAENVKSAEVALAEGWRDPIRFGIGIHTGNGRGGRHRLRAPRAVHGDRRPGQVAARLQDLTKPLGCEVLMSEDVYDRAGFGPDVLPAVEVDARGREAGVKARSRQGGRSRHVAGRAGAGGDISRAA